MSHDEVEEVVRRARKRPLWESGPATRSADFGRLEIERILPHRDPFLFVDRIVRVDLEQCAISGQRRITPSDPVLAGHFPDYPVYPGVLQVETMGQLGLCLAHFTRHRTHTIQTVSKPVRVRALKIHHAVFQEEVRPGDDLAVLARLLDADDYTAICAGQLMKDYDGPAAPTICAVSVSEVYFVDA